MLSYAVVDLYITAFSPRPHWSPVCNQIELVVSSFPNSEHCVRTVVYFIPGVCRLVSRNIVNNPTSQSSKPSALS